MTQTNVLSNLEPVYLAWDELARLKNAQELSAATSIL